MTGMLKTGQRKQSMMKTGMMRSPAGGIVYIFGGIETDQLEKK